MVDFLGWVDLDSGSSHGWWAAAVATYCATVATYCATVATYCPSRMVEHPKYKSTQPRYSTTRVTLYDIMLPTSTSIFRLSEESTTGGTCLRGLLGPPTTRGSSVGRAGRPSSRSRASPLLRPGPGGGTPSQTTGRKWPRAAGFSTVWAIPRGS